MVTKCHSEHGHCKLLVTLKKHDILPIRGTHKFTLSSMDRSYVWLIPLNLLACVHPIAETVGSIYQSRTIGGIYQMFRYYHRITIRMNKPIWYTQKRPIKFLINHARYLWFLLVLKPSVNVFIIYSQRKESKMWENIIYFKFSTSF